jgi:hypothetical protein
MVDKRRKLVGACTGAKAGSLSGMMEAKTDVSQPVTRFSLGAGCADNIQQQSEQINGARQMRPVEHPGNQRRRGRGRRRAGFGKRRTRFIFSSLPPPPRRLSQKLTEPSTSWLQRASTPASCYGTELKRLGSRRPQKISWADDEELGAPALCDSSHRARLTPRG